MMTHEWSCHVHTGMITLRADGSRPFRNPSHHICTLARNHPRNPPNPPSTHHGRGASDRRAQPSAPIVCKLMEWTVACAMACTILYYVCAHVWQNVFAGDAGAHVVVAVVPGVVVVVRTTTDERVPVLSLVHNARERAQQLTLNHTPRPHVILACDPRASIAGRCWTVVVGVHKRINMFGMESDTDSKTAGGRRCDEFVSR